MKRQWSSSVGIVLLLALAFSGGAAKVPAAADQAVRIIDLRGDGERMGLAHGQRLGQEIRALDEAYLKQIIRDPKVRQQALMAAFIFRNQLLPEHRAEVLALAKAGGMDPGEMMLANCFLDLLDDLACSTITLPAEASPDHVARFGRNLDFMSFGVADKGTVVFVFHPQGRYAFASVSWPGLIGVLSGMNEHGLTLANMEVHRQKRMPQAMPYSLLYRTVLEQCRTVDEAIELLKKTPRQSANNLMLMDAAGNRAVAEITPEKVVVRQAPAGSALISTNHQRGQEQAKRGLCWRYDQLLTSSSGQFGRIDLPALEKMLGSVAQGGSTLQSMVFEPANRVIYLATGEQATKHPYQKIDLKEHFAR